MTAIFGILESQLPNDTKMSSQLKSFFHRHIYSLWSRNKPFSFCIASTTVPKNTGRCFAKLANDVMVVVKLTEGM